MGFASVGSFPIWIPPFCRSYTVVSCRFTLVFTVLVLPSTFTFWPCEYERDRLKFRFVVWSVWREEPTWNDSRTLERRSNRRSASVPFLKRPRTENNGRQSSLRELPPRTEREF